MVNLKVMNMNRSPINVVDRRRVIQAYMNEIVCGGK
jgi:hypothetical protein